MRPDARTDKQFKQMFQFTHPVWGATQMIYLLHLVQNVSIHAPRVGCDRRGNRQVMVAKVSIHAPRVGCDIDSLEIENMISVSIHAPRVGCDYYKLFRWTTHDTFQFTHPVWGATGINHLWVVKNEVSIHAPRVGCDSVPLLITTGIGSFNSRTPCGVRRSLPAY